MATQQTVKKKVVVEYRLDASKAKKDIYQFTNSLKKLETTTTKGVTALKKIEKTASSMNTTFIRGARLVSAYITTRAISMITQYSDAATILHSRLKLVSNSQAEILQLQDRLYASSIKVRGSYQSMGKIFVDLQTKAKSMNLTNQQSLDIAEGLMMSFRLAGATEQQTSTTLMQTMQGMQSNNLAGDELRTIRESNFLMIEALQKVLGEARGISPKLIDIKEEGAKGNLTAAIQVKAWTSLKSNLEKDFDKLDLTLGQLSSILKSKVIKVIEDIQKWAIFKTFVSFLTSIVKNLEEILIAVSVGGVIGGIGAGATSLAGRRSKAIKDLVPTGALLSSQFAADKQFISEWKTYLKSGGATTAVPLEEIKKSLKGTYKAIPAAGLKAFDFQIEKGGSQLKKINSLLDESALRLAAISKKQGQQTAELAILATSGGKVNNMFDWLWRTTKTVGLSLIKFLKNPLVLLSAAIATLVASIYKAKKANDIQKAERGPNVPTDMAIFWRMFKNNSGLGTIINILNSGFSSIMSALKDVYNGFSRFLDSIPGVGPLEEFTTKQFTELGQGYEANFEREWAIARAELVAERVALIKALDKKDPFREKPEGESAKRKRLNKVQLFDLEHKYLKVMAMMAGDAITATLGATFGKNSLGKSVDKRLPQELEIDKLIIDGKTVAEHIKDNEYKEILKASEASRDLSEAVMDKVLGLTSTMTGLDLTKKRTFEEQSSMMESRKEIDNIYKEMKKEAAWNAAKIDAKFSSVVEDGMNKMMMSMAPMGFFQQPQDQIKANQIIKESNKEVSRTEKTLAAVDAGVKSYMDKLGTYSESISSIVSGAFKQMEDAFTSFLKTGKWDMHSFVNYVLDEMARLAIKKSVMPMVSNILTDAFSSISGVNMGSNKSSSSSSLPPLAPSGVFAGPDLGTTFSGGFNAFMAAPKEVVKERGTTIQVINNSQSKVETTSSTNSNGIEEIKMLIVDTVKGGLGSGEFDSEMNASFGKKRVGTR